MQRNYKKLAAVLVLVLVALALCAPVASAGGSDRDADGIRNASDNCPKQYNPDQKDLDGDGKGDVCDSDRDGDGQLNADDPCPDDALNGCVAPPPPDTTPPETMITTGPAEGSTTTQANASFSFSSSEDNSTFSCQLDGGGFSPCTSPETYNSLSNSSHTFEVQATDAAGNTDDTPARRTWTVNATTQSDPVFVGAGDIASCASSGDEATANLLDGIPGTVYTLGDNVYEDGTAEEFTNCYDPSWGRHKARTNPSVGNHEYHTAGASGYYNYFGDAASPTEPGCRVNCKGYYSYDLGAWHIIALNSMCENVGGCGATSPMVTWLKGDLAANPSSSCTLAYWHHPVFSSGSAHGNDPKMIPSWDALYAGGADVVLSGHDHDYERFAPQTSSGVADPAQGIREFVVGTGGRSHRAFGTIRANSEVQNSDTYGVLKLTLHASSYEWQFVPEAGKTFSDFGSGSCHSAPPQPTDRPGPPSVTGTDPGAVTGVATTTNVTAFFSEEMDRNTINTKTFKLFKKGSSTKIPAGVTYFPDDPTTDTVEARATLDPNDSLRSGVTYKAVATTGAKDSVGTPLPQNYKWFFTTQ